MSISCRLFTVGGDDVPQLGQLVVRKFKWSLDNEASALWLDGTP